MAQRCGECGGDVFVGETRCTHCGAAVLPTTGATSDDGFAGDEHLPERSDLPPEGIQLIIDKQRTDQELYRDHDDGRYRNPNDVGGFLDPLGRSFYDDELDRVGELMRPERDREGKIQWDAKYAIYGAFLVAVFAAATYYWFVRTGSVPKYSTVAR